VPDQVTGKPVIRLDEFDREKMRGMSNKGLELLKRSLTQDERELIVWLVEHGTYKNRVQLKSQIDILSVHQRFTCGCPTIYFALNGMPVPRNGERLVSDHLATVDGEDVGVMLFETDGNLSSLDVYSCAGSDQPCGLPKIRQIRNAFIAACPLGGTANGRQCSVEFSNSEGSNR
jgi:hypothetical protein